MLTAGGRSCPVIKTVEPVILGGRQHLLESFFDITERKRAEEDCENGKKNIERFWILWKKGYFEVDLKGNFSFVNDSLCKMVKASSKDQLLGLNHREYMDEETARRVYKIFREVYNSGQPAKMVEYEVTKRDGNKFFQKSSVYLMRNAQGEPTGFRGILRDVTERKKAEEALRESEKTAQQLAQENTVMAEIGRIIGSTLNVEEVYERFADEVRRLIQFDGIAVSIINPQENTFFIPYFTGREVREREPGKVVPLTGSGTERVKENRSSLLILEHNREEMMVNFQVFGLFLMPVFAR